MNTTKDTFMALNTGNAEGFGNSVPGTDEEQVYKSLYHANYYYV